MAKNTQVLKLIKNMSVRHLFRGVIKKYRNPTVRIIMLHALILVAFFTAMGNLTPINQWCFWIFSISALLLGILHTWLLYYVHEWSSRNTTFGSRELFFTIIVNGLGASGIYLMFQKDLASFAAITTTTFLLPFLFDRVLHIFMGIPAKEFPPLVVTTLEDIRRVFPNEPNSKGIVWHFDSKNKTLPQNALRMYLPSNENAPSFDGKKLSLEILFKIFVLKYNDDATMVGKPIIQLHNAEGECIQWELYKKQFGSKFILNFSKELRESWIPFKRFRDQNKYGQYVNMKVANIYIKRIN